MAILTSSRNLLIFGGLGVFALGWGGGLLLGAFSSTDAEPPPANPQLVDADAYSTSKDGDQAKAPDKSSSLLEQVFGLDDLEEEKPAVPARKPSGAVSESVPAPSEKSEIPSAELADQIMQGSQPAAEPVELEDSPDAADAAPPPKSPADEARAPAEDAAPSEAKPSRDILDENPYK